MRIFLKKVTCGYAVGVFCSGACFAHVILVLHS